MCDSCLFATMCFLLTFFMAKYFLCCRVVTYSTWSTSMRLNQMNSILVSKQETNPAKIKSVMSVFSCVIPARLFRSLRLRAWWVLLDSCPPDTAQESHLSASEMFSPWERQHTLYIIHLEMNHDLQTIYRCRHQTDWGSPAWEKQKWYNIRFKSFTCNIMV